MNLKKTASKGIAFALVGVTIGTASVNYVNAIGSNSEKQILQINDISESELVEAKQNRDEFTKNTPVSKVYSEEQEKLYKVEFQKEHGIEDKFEVYTEENGLKTEVNGAKGIVRMTDIDINSESYGEVTEINLFEGLEDARIIASENNEEISMFVNRPTSWKTQGPDRANLIVKKGSSRDSIKAYDPSIFNTSGKHKSYTKPTNSWYTGYTKGYYDSVQKARRSFGTAKSSFAKGNEYAITAVATQFLKKEVFKVESSKFLTAVKVMYAGASATEYANASRYGVAYLANMGEVKYNYSKL